MPLQGPILRQPTLMQSGQPTVADLNSSMAAFIQAQQAPQQLQNNQLNQMLEQALLKEKLLDLQDPNRSVMRDVQQQLARNLAVPNSGYSFDPQAAALGSISQPRTVNVDPTTGAETQVTPRGADIVPVGNSGFLYNEAIPLQAAQRKQDSSIALLQAKADAAGQAVQYIPTADGGISVLPKTVKKDVTPTAAPVLGTDGAPIKAAPKGGTGSGRGLTPNAQTVILNRASSNGIDPDSEKYLNPETNTYDFIKLAIDAGKAAREGKRLENERKASELTGTSKTSVEGLNAAEKQLHVLQDDIDDIIKSGKEPGVWDNMVAAATAAPPDGMLAAMYQQLLKFTQGEESKELEGKKSIIQSALTKAISGLAVTDSEARRLGFLPRPGESFKDLMMKVTLVESYIKNQRSGLQQGTPSATPEQNSSNAPSVTSPAKPKFRIVNTRP